MKYKSDSVLIGKKEGVKVYRFAHTLERYPIGTRFETNKELKYVDNTFPCGISVTFMGFDPIEETKRYGEHYFSFARFKFDGDDKENRVIDDIDLIYEN